MSGLLVAAMFSSSIYNFMEQRTKALQRWYRLSGAIGRIVASVLSLVFVVVAIFAGKVWWLAAGATVLFAVAGVLKLRGVDNPTVEVEVTGHGGAVRKKLKTSPSERKSSWLTVAGVLLTLANLYLLVGSARSTFEAFALYAFPALLVLSMVVAVGPAPLAIRMTQKKAELMDRVRGSASILALSLCALLFALLEVFYPTILAGGLCWLFSTFLVRGNSRDPEKAGPAAYGWYRVVLFVAGMVAIGASLFQVVPLVASMAP